MTYNPFSSFGGRPARRDGDYVGVVNGAGARSGGTRSHGGGSSPDQRAPADGRSYVRGDTTQALHHQTIPAFLAATVRRHGPRPAAVFAAEGLRWTWYDLAQRVDDLATGLLSLGIGRGDRVGIWSPNRSEWLLTQFATARIGAVLVNINPAYRLAEVEYALNAVQVKALITATSFKSNDYLQMLQTLAPEISGSQPGHLLSTKLPHLRTVIYLGQEPRAGLLTFASVLALAGPAHRARLEALTAELDADDAINIQFTSGTTGNPKGATLSHYNIVNNARAVAAAMRLSEHDRLCIPVPLYHCFGMVLGVLACVASGAAMVFPGEAFEPVATLRTVSSERCTALHGVPTMFIAMLECPEFGGFDLSSLRTGIMAGAPCPIETMKRVVSDMHMPEVTIAYGMTETSPVSFQSSVDDPLEKRVATVGRIMPHLEVKIVDDNGRVAPVGQPGELCTRGYSVMKGYWGDPKRTAEAIRDGWMYTGDLATLDADGYCNIVGRLKDMLIRGGENVFPREIEEYLFRHPDIQEVQVFGVPDVRYGEEIACWIVRRPGASLTQEQVREFCRGQIAHYKIPRYVQFVQAMPMTVTGKPQKFIMRETLMRELGLVARQTA